MSQCPKCFEPLYACCCNVPEIDALETHKPPVQPRVMPDVGNIVKESLRNQYELLRACEEKDAEIERLRAALREIASMPTCPGAERERLIHVARAALGDER